MVALLVDDGRFRPGARRRCLLLSIDIATPWGRLRRGGRHGVYNSRAQLKRGRCRDMLVTADDDDAREPDQTGPGWCNV